ncbi:MAG TPA: hypothetical protein VLF14_03840 [Candidatus Binatia bacterium]|nr:hypothetical protein [Candidatus Binatia bacterium]
MNWRTTFALGMLAASLSLAFVSQAAADPPPWAGVWRHNKHVNGEPCDRDDYGDRRETYGRPYYGSYGGHRSYDPEYGKLMDRIAYDRAKIAEIEPTGRHRKALQWYKDDLVNAQRDLYNYRYRAAGYDQPPPAYDPYYQPTGSYDPYYGDTGRSFDWKHDWPMLLGQLLVQPR